MANNCTYKIILNGKEVEFSSQEELNSFIDNNYYRLKARTLDVKFSREFDPREEAIAKLKKAQSDSDDITQTFDEDGVKQLHVGKGYKGVTRKIDEVRVIDGKRIVKEFNADNYIKNNLDLYTAALKEDPRFADLPQLVLQQKAEEQIKQQLSNWKMLGVMGTDIHSMTEAFFKEGITNPQEMLDRIQKPFTLETMKKYMSVLQEIKQRIINDTGDPDPRIFTEVKIHDPNSKVAGILDIVAIDKDGKAFIYDLKTSYKKLNDWNNSKVNKMYYQMAFYKQLLAVTGISTKGINIIPLELIDVDYNNNLVSDLKLEVNQDINQVMSNYPRIGQMAREVIPTSINSLLDVHVESSKIKTQLNDAFGYEVKNAHVYGLETFQKTKVKINDDGKQYFYDNIKNKTVVLSGDETRDKATIEKYLTDQAITKNDVVITTKNALIRKSENPELDLLATIDKTNYSLKKAAYTNRIFSPYTDGSWEVINSPDLDALGVLGFSNKYTSALEFVSITANDLTSKIPLAKGTTILGNHVTDESLRQDKRVYAATGATMEALKVAMFLNDNMSKFVGADSNASIGMIRVVNLDYCQSAGINLDDLIYNYGKLSQYTGVVNELSKMKRSNPFDTLVNKVHYLIESDQTPAALRTRMENMKDILSPDEDGNIITGLKELQAQLVREHDIDVDKISKFDSPVEQIYALVNDSILYYEGLQVRFEDNMKQYSLNNSVLFSNIDSIASKNVQIENSLVKNAMYNIGALHVRFKESTRGMYEKLFDGVGLSKASRLIIGNHIDAYDNLYIREKDTNKIANQFRVKDPANMQNDLKPAEREFLKTYLKELNDIRYKGKSTEDILDAKLSGEYFDVPLLKASAVSRFKNKDYKSIWKDYYDNVLNYYNLFKENQAESKRIANDMLDMFNPFNTTVNNRETILLNHDVGDYETDLELVLDTFKMANIRKSEFDRVLPTIHALRAVTKYYHSGLLGKDVDNTLEFMKNYTKTAVYNEKLIEPHLENVTKGLAVLRDVTTKLNLTFSYTSGIREFLQGQWGNMSRIFAQSYGKDMFTRQEYHKAIGYMISDAPDFINNVTAIEELNHIYRISDMDINAIVGRLATAKTGAYAFTGRWQFWFNTGPEYFNRMSLFVAQMLHDGSFDAHKMSGDGKMVYDWKLDKRFSDYANNNKTGTNYEQQKGLYLAMMKDFMSQGLTKEDGSYYKIGDALPYAYTSAQRQSLKSFSDSINGSYDHENKILAQQTMFGMMFFQFKTWLTAKKDQWALKGDTYVQGDYEHKTDENGNKLYLGMDADGSQMVTTEKTETPLYEWKGKWQEGIAVSLGRVFQEIEWGKMNFSKAYDLIKNNHEISSNLKMMSHDLAIVIGLAVVFGMINWKDLKEESPATASILKTITGSANDLFVGNNISAIINPKSFLPSFGYLGQMGSNFFHVITGSESIGKAVSMNIGALRPVSQYFDQMTK